MMNCRGPLAVALALGCSSTTQRAPDGGDGSGGGSDAGADTVSFDADIPDAFPDCGQFTLGLYTQDCKLVPDSQNVAVACVNHQCMTYAAGL